MISRRAYILVSGTPLASLHLRHADYILHTGRHRGRLTRTMTWAPTSIWPLQCLHFHDGALRLRAIMRAGQSRVILHYFQTFTSLLFRHQVDGHRLHFDHRLLGRLFHCLSLRRARAVSLVSKSAHKETDARVPLVSDACARFSRTRKLPCSSLADIAISRWRK